MTLLGSPQFQTPLSLYASLITRLRAIRQARELKRRRDDGKRELARRKAGLEQVIKKNEATPKEREHGHT